MFLQGGYRFNESTRCMVKMEYPKGFSLYSFYEYDYVYSYDMRNKYMHAYLVELHCVPIDSINVYVHLYHIFCRAVVVA